MPKSDCFYAQPTCVNGLTREHVISASVLKAVFGAPVKNIIRGEFLGTKTLIDHEPVVRDVCEKCNNVGLSPYDTAGVGLIKQLATHDPTGLRLFLSRETVGWLLKTHLNYIRVIKDRKTTQIYPIEQRIKSALIQQGKLPHPLFRLLIEGWVGEPHFWDAEDPRHIPWFGYRSVRFTRQRIVISDLRIKTLTTWFVIPSDANYDSFEKRVRSALAEAAQDFGFQLQLVSPSQTVKDGYVDLEHVLPVEAVKKFIVPLQQ